MGVGKEYKEGEVIGECIFIKDALPYITPQGKMIRKALFKCKCGKEFEALITNVKRKNTHSCGCYNLECFNKNKKGEKHGNHKHLLYGIWQNMKNRCYNNKTNSFKYYGGKGVEVCREWRNSFSSFYSWSKDNGWKAGLTIDRINSNGNYEPINCRWTTDLVQGRNRSSNIFVDFNDIKMCLSEYCEINNFNYRRVLNRVTKYKWPLERAISQPSVRDLAILTLEKNPERAF